MDAPAFDRRAHPAGAAFSTWTAPDGWELRRFDWPQPGEAHVRGSLIFMGGRGDFIEKYLEPLAHWHGRSWSIAAFDWRGQGESRGTIVGGNVDSFDPLVADGAALIGAWIAATPGPHVAVGHSMGGHLLARILAEHRPALAAAVLVAPMLGINSTPIPGWAVRQIAGTLTDFGLGGTRAWKEQAATQPFRQHLLTNCDDRYADELWWKQQQPGFELGPPSFGWLSAAYASIAALTPERLAGIAVPVFLIGTDRDRLVSPEAIRAAARAIPDAELHMFADAAHELLREADPVRRESFARIDAFLGAHAA